MAQTRSTFPKALSPQPGAGLGFDLEAELAAGAEAQKNRVKEAAFTSTGPNIEAYLERVSGPGAARERKLTLRVARVMQVIETGDYARAAHMALKMLDADPEFALGNHIMAVALERLGRLSKALEFYERAWRRDPNNPDLYLNLGMAGWKLNMLEVAEKFFRLYMQIAPRAPSGPINLSGVLRDQAKFEDAIEILRAAIYAEPERAEYWNSLGTVLLESGDPVQAHTFYAEALRLDPDFARAHHNIAYACSLLGQAEASLRHYDKALAAPASPEDEATMRHGRALSLLEAGRLGEGWDALQVRLSPYYRQATHFHMAAPYWDGADLDALLGKRLLLIGEQGLGDEILFMTAAGDLFERLGPETSVHIACEGRLVPLFARSFPNASVGPHATIKRDGQARRAPVDPPPHDLWAPMGNLMRALRREASAFSGAAYLVADPDRIADLRARIDALGPGLKVGVAWKSKLMTAQRTKYFSPFARWRPVLETSGAVFVNLQYGDVAEELETEFGGRIHALADLDLMNDLDGVAALGASLDLVIGPMNASLALAAGAGAEAWLITPGRGSWTQFGTDRYPWFANARVFAPKKFGAWGPVMAEIADALHARLALEACA